MKIIHLILILLFLISGIFYYNITGNTVIETKTAFVTRVVDGDTLETDLGKIRLLGINTPEKSMPYYTESKEYVKDLLENNTVTIEITGTDRYGRILAHVFLGKLHINEKILQLGYGSLYYYEKDDYYTKLSLAEQHARTKEIGIWKNSPDKGCINLLKLKYKEDTKRCSNEEILKLENLCEKTISVLIKDDATHIYREKISANSIFSKNFSCIWNDDGDSLYIWDEKGLILFYRY
jgi:endonuclease YncB( thermonuclease family)